jgi:uncharacterized protein
MIGQVVGHDALFGVIQAHDDIQWTVGCAGRIVRIVIPGARTFVVTIEGESRFILRDPMPRGISSSSCVVDFQPFANDLKPRLHERDIDRDGLVAAVRTYIAAYPQTIDWQSIDPAPDEARVNGLAMQIPLPPLDKQLEAPSLEIRLKGLIALTNAAVMAGDLSARSTTSPRTARQ